jgi:hypothetical protein
VFAAKVKNCGTLITKDGVRFDPKHMEALHTVHEPQSGADLVQYVAKVKWMQSTISKYSKRVVTLQAILAKVFDGKSAARSKLQPQCRCYTFGEQRNKRLQ